MAKTTVQTPTPGATRSLRADEGATAIEYALIAALIAVCVLVAVAALGMSLSGNFARLGSAMTAASTLSQ